ncbi:MAG: potassium-transporting ATPase subunit KdpC [Gemmatimonadetes bacterium]|nr:potassium-transporting ATPase subunit KdpC [Gemmatimonadota bacterium]
MRALLRPSAGFLLLATLCTGVLYPLVVRGMAALLFADAATGSVLTVRDRAVGSRLIGQPFTGDGWLIGRPSATGPTPYNSAASSGSNLGPTHPLLDSLVHARAAAVRAREGLADTVRIPVDLLTASASGLDPHISPAAAALQVTRIARVRALPVDSVRAIIQRATTGRLWGVFGEPRVNVLHTNLLLDGAWASSLGHP